MNMNSLRGRRMNLVAERSRRGMSQLDLAKEVGSATSSVSNWETGTVTPSGKKLLMLCDVLDSPAEYLLERFGMDDDG